MQIRIQMTGRGYHTADQLPESLELADNATVRDAIEMLRQQAPGVVVDSMMVLVDGRHVGTVSRCGSATLPPGCELEFVAPVAGG